MVDAGFELAAIEFDLTAPAGGEIRRVAVEQRGGLMEFWKRWKYPEGITCDDGESWVVFRFPLGDDLVVKVDAEVGFGRALEPEQCAAAEERLDVAFVRRHVIDKPLPHPGAELRAGIVAHERVGATRCWW